MRRQHSDTERKSAPRRANKRSNRKLLIKDNDDDLFHYALEWKTIFALLYSPTLSSRFAPALARLLFGLMKIFGTCLPFVSFNVEMLFFGSFSLRFAEKKKLFFTQIVSVVYRKVVSRELQK